MLDHQRGSCNQHIPMSSSNPVSFVCPTPFTGRSCCCSCFVLCLPLLGLTVVHTLTVYTYIPPSSGYTRSLCGISTAHHWLECKWDDLPCHNDLTPAHTLAFRPTSRKCKRVLISGKLTLAVYATQQRMLYCGCANLISPWLLISKLQWSCKTHYESTSPCMKTHWTMLGT